MKRQLPKNVRQIGNVTDSPKIYVEDYVDTFFSQLCDKTEELPIGAFLIGEKLQEEGQDCIFIYGAIRMDEVYVKGQEILIADGVWKKVCETSKEYFGDAEILGWFLVLPEQATELTHNLKKIHGKFFKREKSIFVLKNAVDREEQFFVHKYQDFIACEGHYIYYEKNPEMQNYMIASRKKDGLTQGETIEDRAAKNFRDTIRDKMEKGEEKKSARFIYTASTFLVLVVFVIGITMINNYDKMQGVQQSLDTISETVSNREQEHNQSYQIQSEENKTKQESYQIQSEEENKIKQEPYQSYQIQSEENNAKQKEKEEKEEKEQNQEKEKKEQKEQNQESKQEKNAVQEVVSSKINTTQEDLEAMEEDVYIVEKGDTLVTISKKVYGDIGHVEAICKMNGLEDGNIIFIGQKLLLP